MRPTHADSPQRDFRQEVTDSIIKLMEEGVAPWQKPWSAAAFMPLNHTTQKHYRGGNALYLLVVAMKRGYDDPRWMTYKQAAERNWQVRRGEKGTLVEYWEIKSGVTTKPTGREGEDSNEEGDAGNALTGNTHSRRWIHRVYTVFNASQIDGVPPLATRAPTAFEAVEAAERILTNSGATILYDQIDEAFYNRRSDTIHLPSRQFFPDAGAFYGVALHELAHWSGHPNRLDRPTLNEEYRFGNIHYAQEELRAELASLFLSAERGIPYMPERHAAYVSGWVKALQDDKNEIFRAAHDASAAVDYLVSLGRGQELEKTGAGSWAVVPTHAERIARQSQSRSR